MDDRFDYDPSKDGSKSHKFQPHSHVAPWDRFDFDPSEDREQDKFQPPSVPPMLLLYGSNPFLKLFIKFTDQTLTTLGLARADRVRARILERSIALHYR